MLGFAGAVGAKKGGVQPNISLLPALLRLNPTYLS
jgi:hypothetical protein